MHSFLTGLAKGQPAGWDYRPSLVVRVWRALGAPSEEIDSQVGRLLARSVDDAAERAWWLTVRAAARHQLALRREVRQMRREVAERLAAHDERAARIAAEQEERISALLAEIRQSHGFIRAAQMWHAYRTTDGWQG